MKVVPCRGVVAAAHQQTLILSGVKCAKLLSGARARLSPGSPGNAVGMLIRLQLGGLAGGANRGSSVPQLSEDSRERVAPFGWRSVTCSCTASHTAGHLLPVSLQRQGVLHSGNAPRARH